MSSISYIPVKYQIKCFTLWTSRKQGENPLAPNESSDLLPNKALLPFPEFPTRWQPWADQLKAVRQLSHFPSFIKHLILKVALKDPETSTSALAHKSHSRIWSLESGLVFLHWKTVQNALTMRGWDLSLHGNPRTIQGRMNPTARMGHKFPMRQGQSGKILEQSQGSFPTLVTRRVSRPEGTLGRPGWNPVLFWLWVHLQWKHCRRKSCLWAKIHLLHLLTSHFSLGVP